MFFLSEQYQRQFNKRSMNRSLSGIRTVVTGTMFSGAYNQLLIVLVVLVNHLCDEVNITLSLLSNGT